MIRESQHLVFLGLYNADSFRSQISNWIRELDLSGAQLLVVDNGSTDSTTTWAGELVGRGNDNFTFRINEQNFGGYGSLINNLDLIAKYKWVTTLHQDDCYESNHVQKHIQHISSCEENVGMVFSESLSVDSTGNRIAYPRGHWLLAAESDPVDIFLAHIRSHIFPFSGASFRTQVLSEIYVPSQSTAFPDTELVLKMTPDYEFSKVKNNYVTYLENPKSESHSLSTGERDQGAAEALVRVFTDASFLRLLSLIPPERFGDFLFELCNSLAIRLTDERNRIETTRLAIAQSLAYLGLPSKAQTLEKQFPNKPWGIILNRGQNPKSVRNVPTSRSSFGRFALAAMRCLPLSAQENLFKISMHLKFVRKYFPQWDFSFKGRFSKPSNLTDLG